MTTDKSRDMGLTLWLGGSSSLAHTYVNQFGHSGLLLSGLEETPPLWAALLSIDYIAVDLTTLTDSQAKLLFFQE
jgi:hypothetical protein